MITRGFVEKIRTYFDELGIEAKDGISYREFEKQSIKTINRCKDLSDSQNAIQFYNYCSFKWKKIEKIFTKYLEVWKEYKFEDSALIETVDDEEDAEGTYTITNAITDNREIFLTSKSFEDELYSFKYHKGRYVLNDDNNYYLKYSKTNPCVMKLFNNEDELLCNIILSEDMEIFLEKNKTKYELVIKKAEEDDEADEGSFVGIFEKSYIDSLADTDYIEFENMVADIEWDLLKEKSDVGVARLNLYKELDDTDTLFYFATSTFLLYKEFSDASKVSSSRNIALMTGISYNINRR